MTRVGSLLLIGLFALGCSKRDEPEVKREPERPRRVIEPPSRGVRALPPHAIRADGVGPYKLGAPAAELLDQLPSGPRIRQFTIPGIVHRDMLRGEDDAILIGTEPQGRATFIAVVRGEIARTEAGIQVGSSRAELEAALGPPLEELDRARDPRVVIPSKLANAQVVIEADRIVAIVITPAIERAKEPAAEPKALKEGKELEIPKQPGPPTRGAGDGKAHKDGKDHGCTRPSGDQVRGVFGACLTGVGELLRARRDELAILGRDSEKAIATARVPGLVFAAPIRNAHDGRDDIVAIVRAEADDVRTWSLIAYRLIDGKLTRIVESTPLFQLTAANARWIGADLRDIDMFLEVTARPDSLEVGGLLATRVGQNIRDIVVISPVAVARRRPRSPPPEPPPGAASAAAPRPPADERTPP